jgi:hypothetical protein
MVYTKGNVVIENIKIGDVHYEFEYGLCCKSEVISLPTRNKDGYWSWQSKSLIDGRIIDYGVTEGMSHYGPNLYDHEAYQGAKMI